jgi:hypothetical protein
LTRRRRGAHAIAIVALALCATAAVANAINDDVHLGVASCATGVCHGKLTPQKDRNVALNEYRVWSAEDRHARAYQTLLSAQSKQIADKLGIPSAQASDRCLDCHADNVKQNLRGPKFQISDGIQCEACHGGSARWIETHTEATATHAANMARGMYPTEQPTARADLCLRCHLGAEDRFATHEMMGAGHPRLSFELDAFSTNQPAHYIVDDDYVRRKGHIEGFNLWLTGQLAAAARVCALASGPWFHGAQPMYPELAFYNCDACHHQMDDRRWDRRVAGPGIPPGSLRLQTDHLLVLQATADALDPGGAGALSRIANEFVKAGQRSVAAVADSSANIAKWVTAHQSDWVGRSFTKAEVGQVRRSLARYAADGRMGDFAAAEQTFLAIESLSLYIGDATRIRAPLDALFKTVESNGKFDPARFAAAAKPLLAVL